ncbi:MAG: glutathione S-transferase family protein [Solirubrobacteraceae bacterium]|jgi:glutathione S-transferase
MTELRLYDYAASANCFKVRLALAQLRLPCERVAVDIFAGETLTEEFRAINPARTTPVLEIGGGDGATYLRESAAILFYLAEGTALLPPGRLARAQVIRWLIIEQTDVIPTMGGLRFRLATGRLHAGDPEARRRFTAATEVLALYDEHLARHDFLAGDAYSIADIAGYAYIHVAPQAGLGFERHPSLRAWLARVEARPGFINDLAPYPGNARAGVSRSIYDAANTDG